MKYWFDKKEKEEEEPQIFSAWKHLFICSSYLQGTQLSEEIFNPIDWIYVKEDGKLEDWYSRLYILHDYLDDAITDLNKELT